MQILYLLNALKTYKIKNGYYLIDDTMEHHSNFCKWIHGLFCFFDHALKTNLKAICIVFLYFTDGDSIKFPITFRIFYKDINNMPWKKNQKFEHQTQYALAIEMLEWTLKNGFPPCPVLADSWYGMEPFLKELRRLGLKYVVEIKVSYNIQVPCGQPKLTPTGRLSKKQYELKDLSEFFKSISTVTRCGLAFDIENGKKTKILYHTKIATVRLNAMDGKHRVVESIDPAKNTVKYLLTNQLTWDAVKILSAYSHRWVIEEFFKNAKQFSDMEGAAVRSEQGVTVSLCLVSYIDFLLHLENYKQSTVEGLTKESLTIPSIVRQAQYDNLKDFMERAVQDNGLIQKWFEVEKDRVKRRRKPRHELIAVDEDTESELDLAA